MRTMRNNDNDDDHNNNDENKLLLFHATKFGVVYYSAIDTWNRA